MDRTSTLFLRIVILLMGAVVLAACALWLPQLILTELTQSDFDYAPILIGMFASAIPFFIALHQAMKLLAYIDQDTAFSEQSVHALRRIKHCAAAFAGVYAVGMPYTFRIAQLDDAPGLVAFGIILIGAGLVVAVFAAVLQKLLRNAIDIQAENDLTV